ncbi:MAG: hypothetical protein FWH26_01950 [Oscillospiraceae bacterium]|nr:hypothetical protein [Oscillospiraceae bacterium]
MAYIGQQNTADTRLYEAVEYGLYSDPRSKSPLATTNGALLVNGGTTMLPMINFNFALIAPTSGYFYSGETVTTGFYVGGTQIKLCKPGCRPRTQKVNGNYPWKSGAAGTAYINRFTDGEVWISGTPNSRSGSQLSYKLNQAVSLPRGIRYLIVQVVGGGGGGSYRGLGASTSGCGGSSAIGVCMIKLPENGYATITVGGAGAGSDAMMGDGYPGGDSKITCGSFYFTAGGGKPGTYGTFGGGGGAGGTVSTSGDNADGRIIVQGNGNAGSQGSPGIGVSRSYTDWAPEGGTSNWVSAAGGAGATSAYGSGSPGVIGDIIMSY